MNMVCCECGPLCTWSVMTAICYKRMNVLSNEQGL